MSRTHEDGPVGEAVALLGRVREGLRAGGESAGGATRALAELPRSSRATLAMAGRRLLGEYHEDEWGFDEELAEGLYPLLELLYSTWWRVELNGISRVPGHGRAMLAANHGGAALPLVAAMLAVGLMKGHPLPRWPRFMVAGETFEQPFSSALLRRLGAIATSAPNAVRALSADELLVLAPGSLSADRGPGREGRRPVRAGFVEVALRTRSPIIPVAVVSSGTSIPSPEGLAPGAGQLAGLARAALGTVTPLPGLPRGTFPPPGRWRIELCEPMDIASHPPELVRDPGAALRLADQVDGRIAARVRAMIAQRG